MDRLQGIEGILGRGWGLFLREYDGALASDLVYLHGEYAESLFRREIKENVKNPGEINVKYFFPPPTRFGTQRFSLGTDKKIILFNHRLNNTTNWRYVLDTAKKLYEQRDDFVLWMTDDSGSLPDIEQLNSLPFVILKRVPFDNYGYLMQQSHFAVFHEE